MTDDDVAAAFHRHRFTMQRALLGYCGDYQIAEEAVAEVFFQLLRTETEVRDVEAWLWSSVFRIAKGMLEDRDTPLAMGIMPEGAEADPETPWDLLAALQQLPDEERRRILLRHVAGYTPVEIAGMYGTSSAVVRVQLHRTRSKLRRLLEPMRTDPPDEETS